MGLASFVRESNYIEGIDRKPTAEELQATKVFLNLGTITVESLIDLVKVYQPNATLRDRVGLNVQVGDHIAPPGGPSIRDALAFILKAHRDPDSAYNVHQMYEWQHPFTDGNGRSGRALWLWHMGGEAPLGFLHTWYYQSLQQGG